MTPTRRVLITGSREWDIEDTIYAALDAEADGTPDGGILVVVHGCARGADSLAAQWVEQQREQGMGYITEERHPADWQGLGKRAGYVRNEHMVRLGADVCLGFIRAGSRGASHTVSLAHEAGIPTLTWTQA